MKLFAILRERAGISEMTLDLPAETTVDRAIEVLAKAHPELEDFLKRIAVAVNQEYVECSRVLRDDDELALIPPVSGG